jgi:hypothetical protein
VAAGLKVEFGRDGSKHVVDAVHWNWLTERAESPALKNALAHVVQELELAKFRQWRICPLCARAFPKQRKTQACSRCRKELTRRQVQWRIKHAPGNPVEFRVTPSRESLPLELVIAPGVNAPAALRRISVKPRPDDEYLEPEEKALRWFRSNPEALRRALQAVEFSSDKSGFIWCLNSDEVFRHQFFREVIRLLGKNSPLPLVALTGLWPYVPAVPETVRRKLEPLEKERREIEELLKEQTCTPELEKRLDELRRLAEVICSPYRVTTGSRWPSLHEILDYMRQGGTLPIMADALLLPMELVGTPEGTAIRLQAMLLEEVGWRVSCCQQCNQLYAVPTDGLGGFCPTHRLVGEPKEEDHVKI